MMVTDLSNILQYTDEGVFGSKQERDKLNSYHKTDFEY